MRTKFKLVATLVVVIFLAACSRNTVSLDYTNATGEVPVLGNLVFRFSKPLMKDSLLNQWDSVGYISFEPRIPGRFRWEHPDELVFSPSQPLPPATSFTASIGKEILQFSTHDKVVTKDPIRFRTPDLKLENTNLTWVATEGQPDAAFPRLDLYFNYPVDPAGIREKLQLKAGDQPLAFTIETAAADSKLSLKITGLKMEDKDIETALQLEKGIVPKGGVNATPEKIETKLFIPSPYNLTINDVTAEHDGAGGTIYVRTSQQVVLSQLSSHVSMKPTAKLALEATDEGFSITSADFDAAKSYLLSISKGLRGVIGGTLRENYDNNIAFGELEPSVRFTNSKAIYLSGAGNKNIEVRITNMPKVKVVISRIYENNILAAQRYGYYPKDDRGEDGYYYDYNEGAELDLGDVVYEKEIETKSLPKYGNSRLFTFDPQDKLSDFKGIYHIKIRSTTDYWVADSRFISLSDIGVIAREAKDKIVVFANSIKTAQPLNGVNMVAYGTNNQVLGNATTNAEGVAEIALSRRQFAGFKPAMIIAKTAGDFNYLPFGSTIVNTSRFEVGGKRANSTGLDAFIYPERDMYRPGETVHFSVILRDGKWKSPGELPIKMRFLMPNGKELKAFRKTLNEQGAAEGDIPLAVSAITGSYTLEVYTGNDVLLNTRSFNIEEFVPDRIKVSAKIDKPVMQPGQTGTISVNALNFFGPPAANRKYEFEAQIKQRSFRPKGLGKYDFAVKNAPVSFENMVEEGVTDASGNATETYEVPVNFKNTGLLQATFYATVFDESGRPVSRSVNADIYTQDIFAGIGSDGYWYYPLNQAIRFPLVAVNKEEQPQSAQLSVKVIKHEYRTVLTRNGDYFRYESQKESRTVAEQNVSVSGTNGSYSYVPRSPGNYEIQVALPGAASYVSRTFYSYGFWGGDNTSFEVDTEGNIDIELDRSSYKSGESVKALFKAPFNGRMLVTMETDQLVHYQYVEVVNRTASVDLKLTTEHIPNVYITATLIKPHDLSETPLTVAHGFQNVRVEEPGRKMDVTVVAQTAVRSRTHQKVTVKASPGSMVTLAAVDNGVLQISDFKTPDPYGYFYANKALEVTSYDLYPLLFPELRARISSTGGDGELEMNKRTNPMPAKRVKVVSYWSGIQKANSGGEAQFEFDVPQFSGELRLMAVAYKDEQFGSKEAAMKVADPLVISTALPRFLSPKDTISVPVTLTNTTARASNGTAKISVTGPLQIVGAPGQSVQLSPNSETRVLFQVVASPSIATGKVKIDVSSGGEQFSDETEIGVRPSAPLQVQTGSGVWNGSGSQRVGIALNGFLPGTTDYSLVISRSPALELGKQLRYLVQYPYGCTEQTVSVAFPQLYYNDLISQMHQEKRGGSTAAVNVQEAIRKIKLRQLYNGAVTLWDGEGEAHWWASVYAAHFLIEAKKAGFDVEKSVQDGLLNYLNNRLRSRETINYYYNQKEQKKIAPKEVSYSLYVLALAGRPNVPVMNYYKANPALLSLDARYLLAVAYAVSGDKARFKEMLPGSFAGEVAVAQTGGSFYSDIRDEAIALNALLDVDPGNAQIGVMAKHVADKLKMRYWYSTQECAFSFVALGKIAKAANAATVTAELVVGGKTVGTVNGATARFTAKQLGGTDITIRTKGEGRLYYFWQSEGISATGDYKEEDSYIKVRKRFFDRNGKAIAGNQFRQNDLVVVQITLENTYSTPVDNVVITDMLPAGFEIENPRTREIPGMDWVKDASNPTALDVRDDRINLFVDVRNNTKQVYYYAVRAISPGIFRMGPVAAEAMYNGEYHSYHGAGTIRITQ